MPDWRRRKDCIPAGIKSQGNPEIASTTTASFSPAPNMSTNPPCSLRPMKIVKQADMLMDQAQVLYERYEDTMEPTDRTVAEDSMIM